MRLSGRERIKKRAESIESLRRENKELHRKNGRLEKENEELRQDGELPPFLLLCPGPFNNNIGSGFLGLPVLESTPRIEKKHGGL